MTDTIQNQPKTRRDAIEMDNVRSQKANLRKNTDANQLLSLRKRLDVLLRTGQLLLESSADTNRIRRNMVRAALFLGFNEDNLHIFIDHNILMVNYSDEAHSFTKFQKRVKDGINFTTIEAISHLTYKAVRKHFSVEDYEAELEKIADSDERINRGHAAEMVLFGHDVETSLASKAKVDGYFNGEKLQLKASLISWKGTKNNGMGSATFVAA